MIDTKSLVKYWQGTAEHSYETMISLYKSKRYSDCLFYGHIVLEKILKALVVTKIHKEAPFIHNLISLWNIAGLPLDDKIEIFLAEINEFNIRTRYPEYKLNFYKKCTLNFTKKYFDKIIATYSELCQKLN